MDTKLNMRFINLQGVVYVRAEDVANYLNDWAERENSETKELVEEVAEKFQNLGKRKNKEKK